VKLSIIIPVYNEARTVGEVIDRVRGIDFGVDKEIIVVNDGSSDGTREALQRFESGVTGVRVHQSPVNLGKGSSVRIGFSYATGDIVTIQDADLELDPIEYKKLIQPILDGEADVVYGSRFLEAGKRGSLPFYLANRGLAVLTNVLYGSRLTDIETCYKVLRREVLDSLTLRASRFEIEPELTAQVLKHGFRLRELAVAYNPRSKAEGKKISWRDGFGAVSMLVNQRLKK
jgi:glycosyltransferase involved in cell wall biosynthesis